MPEKRNTILFGALLILSLSYWISSSFMIGDKPFQITLLEDEETELNENLISVRKHGGEDLGQLSLEDFTLMIKNEIDKSLV